MRAILGCFYFWKEEGESVEIKDIVKRTQPDTYSKLKPNRKRHSKKKLTERDYEELMKHSSYKRTGGAIRQVRQ